MKKTKDENYYANLDKRTKEYKAWKAKRQESAEGLGDTVEKITEATGIKAAVKFIAGEDCGCDQRKEKLNKLFSYRKPLCLKEDEYIYLQDFFEGPNNTITYKTQLELLKIYNRVFQQNKKPTSCGSCLRTVIQELKEYVNEYND
jgi:hypothetical protein